MRYSFRVSHNCGISYHQEAESDDENDPVFEKAAQRCEDHHLRFVIIDQEAEDRESVVGFGDIHQQTLALLGGPYRQKTMEEKVASLKQHFRSK